MKYFKIEIYSKNLYDCFLVSTVNEVHITNVINYCDLIYASMGFHYSITDITDQVHA
jgi:hypothetical protein